MKKKSFYTAIIAVLVLVMLFVTTGCNNIRTDKDYSFYTYEMTQGTFMKNTGKFVFNKNNYFVYDNTNTVVSYGEYEQDNSVISLIPDKIGTANRLAATFSIVRYKEYLIDLTAPTVILRVGETTFEDRSDLEGIYSANIKLSKGKVFESADRSDTPTSYTEKVGTYEINKDKDFITFYRDGGTVSAFLIFTYTDTYGYEVKGLTQRFYSHKKVNFKQLDQTIVEYEKSFFQNKSTDGGTASYPLSLISYPSKERVSGDVSYRIVGTNPQASLNGSTLSFTGTGAVQIEYTYGTFKGTKWIYIIDFKLKTANPDSARTFNVGNTVNYRNIISAVADYTRYAFTHESIEIKNSTKAEAKGGFVTFKEAGTVEAILTIRNVNTYADGRVEALELKQSIHLIIV